MTQVSVWLWLQSLHTALLVLAHFSLALAHCSLDLVAWASFSFEGHTRCGHSFTLLWGLCPHNTCDGMCSASSHACREGSSILHHIATQTGHKHCTPFSWYTNSGSYTDFLNAPKALDVCAIRLSTSTSIFPELSIIKPRYGNSCTTSILPPSRAIYSWSSSSTILPVTICFVFGMLTVRPKALLTCWYFNAVNSAPDLVDAREHHHQQKTCVQVDEYWCHTTSLSETISPLVFHPVLFHSDRSWLLCPNGKTWSDWQFPLAYQAFSGPSIKPF